MSLSETPDAPIETYMIILGLAIKGSMGGEQSIRELLKINPNVRAIVSGGCFDDPVMP